MKTILMSRGVATKLQNKHNVTKREVEQCFENIVGTYLTDDREECRTDPPTLWFIAPTNCERLLKVVFIHVVDGNFHIKTAFEPSDTEIGIYDRVGK